MFSELLKSINRCVDLFTRILYQQRFHTQNQANYSGLLHIKRNRYSTRLVPILAQDAARLYMN